MERRKTTLHTVAVLGLFSIIVHLLPFFLYGNNPLGYDTGFYRRYLIEPFVSFPNSAVPGLGTDALVPRILLDILRIAHVPTDILLYGTYILFFALLPILLFLFLRPTLGQRGAFLAGLLVIGSAVSYNAYWYMLFKNAWALDLMVLAFILIEKRKTALLLLVGAAIALSHETSAIVYLATLGIFFLLERNQRRGIALHGALTLTLFFAVNFSLIHQVSVSLPSAIFLDWRTYLTLSVPFLILILFGVRAFRSTQIPRILIAFGIASFIFPMFHLPFYERIFIFCDLVLAAGAAYAAEYLLDRIEVQNISKHMYLPAAALCVASGLFVGNWWNQVQSLHPLLSASDIREIQSAGTTLPEGAYLLTTADEAPWYEGWTEAHIIAPGLLHDTHNLEAWTSFWNATSSTARIVFLDSFPKPLYISMLGSFDDLLGKVPPCLIEVESHLLYDACPENGAM